MVISKNHSPKKVLLLGAVYPFCDLYDDIRSLGYDAVVCDYFPDAPCKAKASISYDVSTTDVPALIEIAKKHEVSGVVTAFSDRNMMPGYEVAIALGLPTLYTPEIINLITDKSSLKRFFTNLGVPINKYKLLSSNFTDTDLEDLSFPVVTKPVDGYGSNGVTLCEDINAVRNSVSITAKESKDFPRSFLVEEYYASDEISANAWVIDGDVYITCIYDVIKTASNGFKYGNSVFPSKYTSLYMNQIKTLLNTICLNMGIKNGPVSIQCFIGDKGLKVNEFLFRLPGSASYKYTTILGGPNIGKMLIQLCAGDPVEYQNIHSFTPIAECFYYKYKLFATPSKIMHYSLSIDEIRKKIPEVEHISFYREDGYQFKAPLKNNEVIMQIYCKVPKNGGKEYSELLKEIEAEILVEDESGKSIAKVYFSDRDWLRNPIANQ